MFQLVGASVLYPLFVGIPFGYVNPVARCNAVGLVIVAVIPFFFNGVFGADVSLGGTSIIIIVGVILETVKQVESQLLVRNYKGFLN